MKNRKLLKVLSIVLVVCMLATFFVACGNKNENENKPGAISGNYVAATDKTFKEAYDSVNASKLLGDMTADEFSYGFKLKTDLSASVSAGKDMSAKGSVKAEMTVTGSSLEFDDILGAGNATVEYTLKGIPDTEDGTQKISANAYINATQDGIFAYGIADMGKEEKMKAKVNIMSLMGSMMSLSMADDEESSSSSLPDADTIFKTLEDCKIKVALDTSSGVKIKLSITEESLWAIVDMLMNQDKKAAETEEDEVSPIDFIKDSVKVNKFSIDIYVAIDNDGALSACSIVADVDVKYEAPKLETTAEEDDNSTEPAISSILAEDISVKINGYISIEAGSFKVEVPKGIESDNTYYDATEDVIGMMGKMN